MDILEQMQLEKRLNAAKQIKKKIIDIERLEGLLARNINNSNACMAIEVDDSKHSVCLHGQEVFNDFKHLVVAALRTKHDELAKEYSKI